MRDGGERRGVLWVAACHATFCMLVVEGGFAFLLYRRLTACLSLRGADVLTLLFLLPFNAFPLTLWRALLGPTDPSRWIPLSPARKRRLGAACIVASPVWASSFVITTLFMKDLSVSLAIAEWITVFAAGGAGYLLSPRYDRYRASRPERPRVTPPPLPARRRARESDRIPIDSSISEKIDSSPLPVTPWSIRNVDLLPSDEFRFLVKPRLLSRVGGGTFGLALAAGMVGVISLLISKDRSLESIETRYWILVAATVGVIGLLMAIQVIILWDTMEFDVQNDQLTYGPRWARKTRSLSDLAAVQLSRHTSVDNKGRTFRAYQVNLVFEAARVERINVSYHLDRVWSRESASRISRALDVPLIEQTCPSLSKRGNQAKSRLPDRPADR
jgi:hypothetical protein